MSAPVLKTLSRIRESVESGAYYEAQQMYKSTYHRFKAKQQLGDAFHILQEGAVTQLSHGQITCGVELGLLLVEAYTSSAVPADDTAASRLLAIIRAFPLPAGRTPQGARADRSPAFAQGSSSPEVDDCARLVAAGVKWANKNDGAATAARRQHGAFASYLWKAFGPEDVGRALLHFVKGDDAAEFAEALHTCASLGPAVEVDLWLLRATLQVLSAATGHTRAAQLAFARGVFDAFQAKCGMAASPTTHFTELLIRALEAAPTSPSALSMYNLLRDRYGDGVLRRDDSFEPLLERVEATYFNARRRGDAMGGLLGGLFKSLTEAH